MVDMKTLTARTARSRRHSDRTRTDARRALAADLAGYTSPADLLELSAVLARHHDAEAEPVRELVDWTAA